MLEFKFDRVPTLRDLISGALGTGLKNSWQTATELSNEYHRCKLFFLFDIYYCRLMYLAGRETDYLFYKMYKYRNFERRKFVTAGRFALTTKWFFTDEMNEAVDSKRGFLENFKEFHKRDYLLLPHYDNEEMREFLSKHPVVFVKENFSNKGTGVKRYKSEDLLNNEKLLQKICSIDGAMEEGVKQCAEMASLNSDCVNTLRICTMVEKDGTIKIFSAALRIGQKGSAVDNAHAGGMNAPVDINTGIVLQFAIDESGNRYVISPNGQVIPGFRVPHWVKVVESVKSAASKFPSARFVGWDVAITDNGPSFIEANNSCWGGLYQYYDGKWDYFLRQR